MYFLKTIWDYMFLKTLTEKQHLNLIHPNSISRSFFVTPPSGCRMSAKSTFLVIGMKSFFSCPEQLYKCRCWSVRPSVMFVRKLPLQYQKVIKTYLPTYLWESRDTSEKIKIYLFTYETVVTVVTVVRVETGKRKEQIDTFDNQCDVLRAAFCNSRDVL